VARLRWVPPVVLLLGLLAGCGGGPSRPAPAPSRPAQPAAVAGGSCQLLDYADVTKDVGLTFTVAASSQVGRTYTCVMEREGAALPDLMLTVTLVESLDVPTFKAKLVPSGATVLGDLGKVGYTRTVAAGADTGATVEIGWLAGNQRLITLRCRLAKDATATEVAALPAGVLALAHRIDLSSI
jgi:hypothetical protein